MMREGGDLPLTGVERQFFYFFSLHMAGVYEFQRIQAKPDFLFLIIFPLHPGVNRSFILLQNSGRNISSIFVSGVVGGRTNQGFLSALKVSIVSSLAGHALRPLEDNSRISKFFFLKR